MVKVDSDAVKRAYTRWGMAKKSVFEANLALEALPEYAALRRAEQELETAEVLLECLKMLMDKRVL